jgi:hypothetical protein
MAIQFILFFFSLVLHHNNGASFRDMSMLRCIIGA